MRRRHKSVTLQILYGACLLVLASIATCARAQLNVGDNTEMRLSGYLGMGYSGNFDQSGSGHALSGTGDAQPMGAAKASPFHGSADHHLGGTIERPERRSPLDPFRSRRIQDRVDHHTGPADPNRGRIGIGREPDEAVRVLPFPTSHPWGGDDLDSTIGGAKGKVDETEGKHESRRRCLGAERWSTE